MGSMLLRLPGSINPLMVQRAYALHFYESVKNYRSISSVFNSCRLCATANTKMLCSLIL